MPLDYLVNVASVCANKVNGVPDSINLDYVDNYLGEHNVAPVKHRPPVVVANGRVH